MIALYEKVSSDRPNRYRFVRKLETGQNAVWPEGCAVFVDTPADWFTVITIEPGYCNFLTIRETSKLQVIMSRTLNTP